MTQVRTMASHDITCDIDAFATSLEALIGDIPEACDKETEKAVTKSVRKGAKLLRGKYTSGIGKHEWSAEYRGGFSSHVTKGGMETTGEIGNKNKPGLVHLLEKGHATLTGRRTNKYEHMDPAFREIQEDFVVQVENAVGKALG